MKFEMFAINIPVILILMFMNSEAMYLEIIGQKQHVSRRVIKFDLFACLIEGTISGILNEL